MKYVNAKAVLPHGLVEELQEYVQAGYIYIPARENQHKAWGEQSGCRWQSGTPESWMLTGRGYPWRNWGISTAYLSMPYGKLYIRSKRKGAAARGSLFLRI